MQKDSMKTLPVGLAQSFLGEYAHDYASMMTFAVSASLPIVALFIFFSEIYDCRSDGRRRQRVRNFSINTFGMPYALKNSVNGGYMITSAYVKEQAKNSEQTWWVSRQWTALKARPSKRTRVIYFREPDP